MAFSPLFPATSAAAPAAPAAALPRPVRESSGAATLPRRPPRSPAVRAEAPRVERCGVAARRRLRLDPPSLDTAAEGFRRRLARLARADPAFPAVCLQELEQYGGAMYASLLRREQRLGVGEGWGDVGGVSADHRSILVDWIFEVGSELKLQRRTCLLAVSLIDRMLAGGHAKLTRHLQLLGVTALHMASKWEEIYPPHGVHFANSTSGACTVEDIWACELDMLAAIQWRVEVPTALDFVTSRLALALLEAVDDPKTGPLPPTFFESVFTRCMQLLDLALHDVRSITFAPSALSDAALRIVVPAEHWGLCAPPNPAQVATPRDVALASPSSPPQAPLSPPTAALASAALSTPPRKRSPKRPREPLPSTVTPQSPPFDASDMPQTPPRRPSGRTAAATAESLAAEGFLRDVSAGLNLSLVEGGKGVTKTTSFEERYVQKHFPETLGFMRRKQAAALRARAVLEAEEEFPADLDVPGPAPRDLFDDFSSLEDELCSPAKSPQAPSPPPVEQFPSTVEKLGKRRKFRRTRSTSRSKSEGPPPLPAF